MNKTINIGLFFPILLTLLLAVAPCLYAGANATAEKGAQSEQTITISTGDSIRIEIRNATLHDTLNAITKKSKIDFEVPESLLNDKINFRSTNRDWPETLKKMLKKYNIAYGWEKTGLQKVFIFEHGTGKILQLIPPNIPESADNQSNHPPDTLTDTSAGSATLNNQIPQEILEDPAFLSMPPFPEEEEKIIEIKHAAQDPGSREKKPDMEKADDFSRGVPPELPPDLPGQDMPAQEHIQ